MKPIAIRAESLSKLYRLGQRKIRHETLREKIADLARTPFRRLMPSGRSEEQNNSELIWALKNVSLEVRRGEIIGLIGRNGAGKTTLLKILSRITEPTEGYAEIHGRVGCLLEVGTGFHPELTGRENIYLNGAILGMKKAEIDRKFDEIVAFAEIEKLLDTPVKRYSSGMYVRLAFAVAAHLEADILLVDEVLAVGDEAFQKKCLQKMANIAKEGKTILFVSHNMEAISWLCKEAIWIDEGQIMGRGDTNEIISRYLVQDFGTRAEVDLTGFANRNRLGPARFRWVAIKNAQGTVTNQFQTGDKMIIEFEVCCEESVSEILLSVWFKTSTGIPVLHLVDVDSGFHIKNLLGIKTVRVTVPRLPLSPGLYLLSLSVGDPVGHDYDYVADCLSIDVREEAVTSGRKLSWHHGFVNCQSHWEAVERK